MDEEKEVKTDSDISESSLRAYLLGDLRDEPQLQTIELLILSSDDFAESVFIEEDSLIEDYLDDELSIEDRQKFEKGLNLSGDMRERLRLTKALQVVANPALPVGDNRKATPIHSFLRMSTIRYATAVVAVLLIGFLGWRLWFGASQIDTGIALLRSAYSGKRISESRTSVGFDHAPFIENRGPEKVEPTDKKSLNKARSVILGATADSPQDPELLNALGLTFFAEQDYEAAIAEFEKAISVAPRNARFLNDLGSARFELARRLDETERTESLLNALEAFSKATALDSKNQEALFNRALTLQRIGLNLEATTAWETYLALDPSSPWATEARINIEKLKSAMDNGAVEPRQALLDFLDAARANDAESAWRIVSQTRELITGAMILTQLTRELVAADVRTLEADEVLSALRFLGDIEREKGNDPFARELVQFIERTDAPTRRSINAADLAMRDGYENIRKPDWNAAMTAFESARSQYQLAENLWQAGIAEFQICYTLTQLRRLPESNQRLIQLKTESDQRKHVWLAALASHLIANNYSLLGHHSNAVGFGAEALKGFTSTGDSYWSQNTSNQLTRQYSLIGNQGRAFAIVGGNFDTRNLYYQSRRQTSRNLLTATETMYTFGLYAAARAFADEHLQMSEDRWLTHTARVNLAVIHSAEGNFRQAFDQIQESIRIADSFEDPAMRDRERRRTQLILARIQRESGDCDGAVANYSDLIEYYSRSGTLINIYEARKGRLLCNITKGNDSAIQTEIPALTEYFEANRKAISEESERHTYFDREQTVYDIAAEYAYTHQDNEQAFNIIEQSRARTLLENIDGNESAPLQYSTVRDHIPEGVQILNYAVLPDRLLIWRLSRDEAEVYDRSIDSVALTTLIREYNDDILARRDLTVKSNELYRQLIEPVWAKIASAKRVVIVADKALLTLSFAAIRSPASGRYLIEDFPIAYSPSATLFARRTDSNYTNGIADENILAVGNPSFSRSNHPGLADLADAEDEVSEISKMYPTSHRLIGRSATREAVLDGLGRADVFHFAGHYVTDSRDAYSSALLTADGDLTVGAIRDRDQMQVPRLVVLSACDSGIENYLGGEGIVGASQAFLSARVPLVIGTRWAIDSRNSAHLMVMFHRYRKEGGMSSIEALRRAQIDMLHADDEQGKHPYFWAAYFPIGGNSVY